ncbi:MAG: protease modulator HflC [Halothiobacillaceae bacterium]
MALSNLIIPVVAVVGFLGSMSLYTVKEFETGMQFRLGEIVKTDIEPGLHFKVPFINNVRTFDTRILTVSTQPDRFLTSEKKNLIVDYYIKWRIIDSADYYRATRGDERAAVVRVDQIVKDGMKSQISSLTIPEVVSGDRDLFMRNVIESTNQDIGGLGLEIVDVRIMRIELPSEVSQSVFARMEQERAAVASAVRSRGEEQAQRIRADAERQRIEIVAEANREGEQLRGEGDAQAAEIYAAAFNQDREFFEFYRSINAYKTAFAGQDNMMVLEPSGSYFRFFRDRDADGSAPDAQRPESSSNGLLPATP